MLKEKFISTGNEMISLPYLRQRDAAIQGITFLNMGYKGLIEICGEENTPLFRPFIVIDGFDTNIEDISWERLDYWIPSFKGTNGSLEIFGTILAPIAQRGFIYNLKVSNRGNFKKEVMLGIKGCWCHSKHEINESKIINANKSYYKSNWNESYVFDLKSDIIIFSFAPYFSEKMDISTVDCNNNEKNISFMFGKNLILEPGEEKEISFYWGFGFEEVGATTSANLSLGLS